jgi:rhodanese-related sulfurtransferase
MAEPKRVTSDEIYQRLKSGAVLLVCAYEDDAKFKKMQLQGAISLNEFKSKLPSLAKNQEIVFYCAWTQEASAAGQAAKYIEMGYKNAKALLGGVEAWKKAGYPIIGEK